MGDTQKSTILIVDDDEPTQKLLQALVRRHGFDTDFASNGQVAIERLRAGDYALVILDLMMPTVGGLDVIDFLAAEGRKVPVVVCTASGISPSTTFNPDIVKAVVRKPFDIDQFAATVTGLVQR